MNNVNYTKVVSFSLKLDRKAQTSVVCYQIFRRNTVNWRIHGLQMTSFQKRWGLQQKLMVTLLLLGLLPLTMVLVTSYLSQKATITQTMGTAFQGLAKETSIKLDLLIQELATKAQSIADEKSLQKALKKANAAYPLRNNPDTQDHRLEPEAAQVLRKAIQERADLYEQLLLVDREGGVVGSAYPPRHFQYRDETWWQAAYHRGRGAIYIGDIQWDAELGRYTLPLAMPVRVDGEVLGVLLTVNNVERLFKSVTSVHIGQADHTMLANSKGDLLLCPIFLIKNHILDKAFIREIAKPEPGWKATRIDVHYPGRDAINGFAPVQPEISDLSDQSFGGQRWYIFTSQDPRETYAPLRTLLKWTALSAVLGFGILIGLAVLVSHWIVTPIKKLHGFVQDITEGIRGLPASSDKSGASQSSRPLMKILGSKPALGITTGDEIEELAESFGEMTQALAWTQDQLALTIRRLEESAITDELTGLYNRRFFWETLKDEFSRTKRFHLNLSCLMIDLDFFKKVNDRYGHQAGDQVLKDLARILHKNCRDPDTLARFGGEEFVVILPQTDAKGAVFQAERLRQKVEAHSFMIGAGGMVKMTISVGAASYPDDRITEIGGLVNIADEAMYTSKQQGRNRVVQG